LAPGWAVHLGGNWDNKIGGTILGYRTDRCADENANVESPDS
jgi:hypothetical protein